MINSQHSSEINVAKKAALEVLLHNMNGPFHGLPRTAGWGYPEPYTRDLLISILGIAVSGNEQLLDSIRKVLETLAKHQSERGHISSLVHDSDDRGASDTTPLFLLGVGIYRQVKNESNFLNDAVQKALVWMEYQSPSDLYLVAQQPTSDWRDEQWVLGYGLFVNTLTYSYLKILNQSERAENLYHEMKQFTITGGIMHYHVHEGLVLKHKPYYAFWSYKVYSSERFDLLGNCLAILSGIASPRRADEMVSWIEAECEAMKNNELLAINLPPNFFPFINPNDPDWYERYAEYNNPGEYHNGGIWPFVCGFYIAALVAAKRFELAEQKLMILTECLKKTNTSEQSAAMNADVSVNYMNDKNINYGFNEWIKAQNGEPKGQNWQTWSAAMYLYAVKCVEEKTTPFFDEMRKE
ncbi:amylo-alpha-1,6-glucosidase [Flavobacterium aquariorum]|uniref:beta-fructofuranosidase n=1 Tax=Flavobacterium aquariorum TaxID=2217670 RepID=A0A2W7TR48_9FLAO|nr:glycoside hydrolase 100 family protein [Flavobacterium aquariorum]PZX93013.1 amylo-alpha-1,6-glucosidase [Flavobacterium aquariorum]